MNILYIGPYRHKSDIGKLSKLYLQELKESNFNVTSRPLYLSAMGVENSVDSIFLETESSIFDHYDYCLQHCPVSLLSYSTRFNKNIALPIFPNSTKINDVDTINSINFFDKIVVNNQIDETKAIRSGISDSKLKVIDCPVNESMLKATDQRFSLGIHDANHKFYFVGNYKQDIDVVHKILLAFYIAFRGDIRHSLIMLLEADQQDQENIIKASKEIRTKIRLIPYDNPMSEVYIFQQLSESDNLVLHNSCNTFLNLNQHNINIEKQKAVFFGNNVIDLTNTETVEIPYNTTQTNRYSVGDSVDSIVTNSLVTQMRNFSNQNTKNPKTNVYQKRLTNIL